MLISYKWLNTYVDLPQDLTMEDLAYDLTMRTVEVESTTDLREKYQNIVVGIIRKVSPHPDADRLRVCLVDIGRGEDVQIVCGGSNLTEGHAVICSLPGARVVWHGEGEPVKISESKLRGVDSYGMICGASEVGLSDLFPAPEDHHIVDLTESLPEMTFRAGDNIADLLGLDDFIIEIENKSLTNRPDLWGHYGIARELAAIYHRPLKALPDAQDFFDKDQLKHFPLSIEDPEICHRFLALHLSGVDDRKSPLWLQTSLMKVGIRPINALVDWTNYMMMVTGVPTHAYDEDHIVGGLKVRRAEEGEDLTLLDGKELRLTDKDIVIADEDKALGLAGCMGGAHDSIQASTKETVLEIANFKPQMIRKTAQRYGIRTEASQRHEKGLDTQRMDQTLGVAMALFRELFPEAKALAYSDLTLEETRQEEVEISMTWLSDRLGREVDGEEVEALLQPLGFSLEKEEDDHYRVLVPSWRSTGDVSLPDDILEEVARMIGYENFDLKAPRIALTKAVNQRKQNLDRAIREFLAFQAGAYEIMTYPWSREESLSAMGMGEEDCLTLAQPPAPNQAKLRRSLAANLMDAVVSNVRFYDRFKIFELAQVYEPGESHPSEEAETLPLMHRELCLALVGQDAKDLFYEGKGILEAMPRAVQIDPLIFRQETKPSWADNNAWVNIFYRGKSIGSMGLVSNMVKRDMDLKYHDACLVCLNVEVLTPFDSRSNRYQSLPLYPHVFQDISLVFDEGMAWSAIIQPIVGKVESVSFVDEYRGDQIPQGKKSITLRVELASDEGTLTNAQINEKMKEIRESLEEVGGSQRF
ncbi:phenylalanine--tRNA ligase subunit beta [Kallipyga massiliensis]|uniref:phenylalanine--tRNA ligase subunit beta n=1 Tax=Kallipyga massiliensis TaxID=1472764 RepID=UPI0026F251D3|nr:phenylalanine--tRNA ligase subunit beta [Kallipyga massiliensis]